MYVKFHTDRFGASRGFKFSVLAVKKGILQWDPVTVLHVRVPLPFGQRF